MMRLSLTLLCAACALTANAKSNWPQFRGPGGLGIGSGKPPIEFSADKHLLWKADVPHGHSSPCVWGDKIFLTGLAEGKLVTFCLGRKGGNELWRKPLPQPVIEFGTEASPILTAGTLILRTDKHVFAFNE